MSRIMSASSPARSPVSIETLQSSVAPGPVSDRLLPPFPIGCYPENGYPENGTSTPDELAFLEQAGSSF